MKPWVGILLEQISFFRKKKKGNFLGFWIGFVCFGVFFHVGWGGYFLVWFFFPVLFWCFYFFSKTKRVFASSFLLFFSTRTFFENSWGFPHTPSFFSLECLYLCVQWVSSSAKQLHMFHGFLLFWTGTCSCVLQEHIALEDQQKTGYFMHPFWGLFLAVPWNQFKTLPNYNRTGLCLLPVNKALFCLRDFTCTWLYNGGWKNQAIVILIPDYLSFK